MLREHRVIRVPKDKTELMLVKVLKVLSVLKVHKDIREILEQGTQVPKVLRGIKEQQEQMQVKVHKVIMEHKVPQVLKDIRVIKVDYQHMQCQLVQLLSGLEKLMLFHQDGFFVTVRIAHQT